MSNSLTKSGSILSELISVVFFTTIRLTIRLPYFIEHSRSHCKQCHGERLESNNIRADFLKMLGNLYRLTIAGESYNAIKHLTEV